MGTTGATAPAAILLVASDAACPISAAIRAAVGIPCVTASSTEGGGSAPVAALLGGGVSLELHLVLSGDIDT